MGRNARKRPIAGAHGKSGVLPTFVPLSFRYRSTREALLTCTALCAIVTVAITPLPAVALPQNGQVVSGSAQIVVKANEIDVIQSSSKVVINWSSFNIAAGEKVLFLQGSSAAQALNQILGGGASQILGQLQSNGMVIISNPNGILIGQGADVRVGAIIATTASMSAQAQAAFLAGGKANFDVASASATASVVNRGSITAGQAGLVGLVAPGVENSGLIQARLGTVQLAAGNTFTVDLYGDKLIKLAPGDKVMSQVTAADGTPLTALVSNSGTIQADGGTIILTANAAKTIVTNIINMDGIAQARSVGTSNGEIVLDGGETGVVHVAGTLDASGRDSGQTGGTVKVLGDKVGLFDGARIDVAGDAGGGAVAVGGNFHGAGPDRNASATYVASSAIISADALTTGNGGQVAVWADGITNFNGTISAKGGTLSGNGGFAETSGKLNLHVGATAKVDLSAPKGTTGTWLLDPTDVTITNDFDNGGTWGGSSPNIFTTSGGGDTIDVATLVTNLGTADVNINATNDIVVSSAIDSSGNGSAHDLTLTSGSGQIKLGANITTKGNQIYAGAVVLTQSVTLDSSASNSNVSFSSTVDSDPLRRTLNVYTGTGNVSFGGAIGGSNMLGGVVLTSNTITLGGNVTTQAYQSYNGAVLLGANSTMTSQTTIDFSSTVDSASAAAKSLTIASTGNVTFGGAVGGTNALSSLSVSGNKVLLGGNVTTSGNQTYTAPVILTGAIGTVRTLNSSSGNGNVKFISTVNAASGLYEGLIVNAGSGNVGFGGVVGGTSGLLNLAVTGSHITLGGNVSTGTPGGRYTAGDGNQTYSGAVILGASTTLDVGGPGNLAFSSTVDGTTDGVERLTISQSTSSSFGGSVGGTTRLASLEVNATSDINLGGNVKTSGNQTYSSSGHAYLTSDVALDSSAANGNVYFFGTVSSLATTQRALTIAAGTGNVTFSNPVGEAWTTFRSVLSSLAVTGHDITLNRYVKTSGNQTYNGHVISGNTNGEDLDSSAGNGNLYFASVDGASAYSNNFSLKAGTGNITIGGAVGANTPLSWVRATGSNISLGGNVRTGWAQTYTGKVILTGNSAMDTSTNNGNVTFSSTVNSDGTARALTITSGTGNISFGGAVGGTNALASLNVTSGSALNLGVNVTTTGNQTYNGAVILTADDTLDTSTYGNWGNVYFSSTVDSDGTARALSITSNGNITFGGAVGGGNRLASTDVVGRNITFGGNVTTNGNQTYNGNHVIVAADDTLDSSAGNGNIAFLSALESDSTARALTIASGSGNVLFNAAVGGTNALASLTLTGSSVLKLGVNVTTTGNQTYNNAVVLNSTVILDSSGGNGNVSFGSTLDSDNAPRTVTITAGGGNVGFGGAVGGGNALASLAVTGGKITIGSNVRTNTNQTYTGAVILGGASTLDSSNAGGNIAFSSTVNSDGTARALTIVTETGNVTFGGAVGGVSRLASTDVSGRYITLGGNVTTNGNQTYSGNRVILGASDTLDSSAGNGNIAFLTTLDSDSTARALTIASGSGNVLFNAAVGGTNALASLNLTGSSVLKLGVNVTTTGNQTYAGAVVLNNAVILDSSSGNGNVAFGSTLDSDNAARNVTITAGTGNVGFGGAVGGGNRLASLAVTGGKITIGGNVSTNANQTYSGAVVLSASDTLDSSSGNGNITFSSAIEAASAGVQGLIVTAGTGNVTFGAAEGVNTRLSSLAVTGSTISVGGNVNTNGDQTYTGAVVLPIGSRMQSGTGNVAFSSTVDAGDSAATQTLTVYGTGNVSFGGSVGGINKLASLIATETHITLGANVTTSGGQNYNGAVILGGGGSTLNSQVGNGNIAFSSTLDSASATPANLVIQAGTGNVSFGGVVGAINKVGVLQANGGKILLSNNLNASMITLSNATLLNSLTMNANAVSLSNIDGSTAGGESLTLAGTNSGSATLTGAVGGTTRLASLSASNFTVITIGNGITTSGNQTYGSPTQIRTTSATLDSSAGNGNVAFASTLDARNANTSTLIINAGSGNVGFGGTVGATTPLVGLAVTGGKVTLGGNVTTTGNQTYTGPVVLSATDTLDSSGSNGNVSFTSTVDGTTAEMQGLTVTSGTGSVTFGGLVGSIKALLSRTVNGASLSTKVVTAPAPSTGSTTSTSQTANNVVNTVSSIVGSTSSASSGSTSQSPSAASSGGGIRVAFAPDVFAKDYKLVSISPALSQQNPASNQAGSSLFGGTGTGGNTVAASTSTPATGTGTSTPATGTGATTTNAPATGTKPATTAAPTAGTSVNSGTPAPAVGTGAVASRPVTASQVKAQAAVQAKAQAKAVAVAKAKAKAEAKAEAKAQAQAQAQAKAKALAEAKAEARAQAQAKAKALAEAKAEARAQAGGKNR